jgi:hypothetical protein
MTNRQRLKAFVLKIWVYLFPIPAPISKKDRETYCITSLYVGTLLEFFADIGSIAMLSKEAGAKAEPVEIQVHIKILDGVVTVRRRLYKSKDTENPTPPKRKPAAVGPV